MFDMEDAARKASGASYVLASASTAEKNRALLALAERLDAARAEISEKNAADVEAARKNGLSEAKLDRLTLTKARLDEIIGASGRSHPSPIPWARSLTPACSRTASGSGSAVSPSGSSA